MLHQVGVLFELYYDARKTKLKFTVFFEQGRYLRLSVHLWAANEKALTPTDFVLYINEECWV